MSRHVSKQMFNEVNFVAYGEIFGAIPVEDRSDLPGSFAR